MKLQKVLASFKFFSVFLFFIYPIFLLAINLECAYVHDIQNKYLDLHINYSNLNKKKKDFRKQISILEERVKDQFIKSLDSEKLYFTKPDINNIRKQFRNIFKK